MTNIIIRIRAVDEDTVAALESLLEGLDYALTRS